MIVLPGSVPFAFAASSAAVWLRGFCREPFVPHTLCFAPQNLLHLNRGKGPEKNVSVLITLSKTSGYCRRVVICCVAVEVRCLPT